MERFENRTIEVEKITFDDLKRLHCPSVTDYCRGLVELDDADHVLEVYRDGMLCLIVNDIRLAAKVEPKNGSWIEYKRPNKRLLKAVDAIKQDRGRQVPEKGKKAEK